MNTHYYYYYHVYQNSLLLLEEAQINFSQVTGNQQAIDSSDYPRWVDAWLNKGDDTVGECCGAY